MPFERAIGIIVLVIPHDGPDEPLEEQFVFVFKCVGLEVGRKSMVGGYENKLIRCGGRNWSLTQAQGGSCCIVIPHDTVGSATVDRKIPEDGNQWVKVCLFGLRTDHMTDLAYVSHTSQ